MNDMRLVLLGAGYSATAAAAAMRPGSVTGTARSAEKAEKLESRGIRAVLFNGQPSASLSEAVRTATHVIVSAGPDEGGDPFVRVLERDFAHAENLAWIGYLSTIGVYGDHAGAVIDERAACKATSERGIWRLEAEAAWSALGKRIGVPVALLRLAGIYGPGRNHLVQLRDGTAKRIVKPGQVFNRIHVDDIAAVCAASAARPASRVYNVADDEPAPPQDVVEFAAGLMRVEPPPEVAFEDAQLHPMARSFYADVKRIANGRIREELSVALKHPTYREGLTSLWESGRWSEPF